MDEKSLPLEFEEHRSRLLAVATKTLGSRTDAEDAVQEAWLRLDRYEGEPIDNLGGWLTRVLGRICIDMLRTRAARSESSLDSSATDPIVTDTDEDPENSAVVGESIALAMVLVLESLDPAERLAFVLHDAFAVPFAEIGPIVDRSTGATKMLASRARRKVRGVPQPTGERSQRRAVVDAFLAAARQGDFEALLRLLDPEVSWHRHAAHGDRLTVGADEVLGVVRRGNPDRVQARRVNVNGEPGILAWGPRGRALALMACTVADGRLVDIVSITDPGRLARMELPPRDV